MKDYENIVPSTERLAALGSPDDYRLFRQDIEGMNAKQIADSFRIRTLRATLDALDIPYTVEMTELELARLICGGQPGVETPGKRVFAGATFYPNAAE